MNTLPALPEAHVPALIPIDLGNAVSSLSNALAGGDVLPPDRALSAPLRSQLATRSDDLAGWLAPAGPTEARVMVAALLMVLPGPGSRGSVEDAERVQGLYVRALADLPRFALRAACSAALTRGIGSKKFAPSPPELRAAAEAEANPYRVEREKIGRLLRAKVEGPRPDAATRKASAEAARRSFGIPAGGFSAPGAHREPLDTPDAIGRLASEITAKSNAAYDRWKAGARAEAVGEPPPGRFEGEDAA